MLGFRWFVPGLFLTVTAMTGAAGAARPVNVDGGGMAAGGYVVVAYFASGIAQRGSAQCTSAHDGATDRFASTANLAAFRVSPAKYVPQYGRYCAHGVAGGKKAPIDPTAWRIVDGKLHLNDNREVQRQRLTGTVDYIGKADAKGPAGREN
jgi:YHS domain-containing protein